MPELRRASLPLLLACAFLAISNPARASEIANGAAIEQAAGNLKPVVVTAPAEAMPRLARLQADADRLTDARTRALTSAAIARLRAEAHLRLGEPELAEPLIERSINDVRRLAPKSSLLPDLLLSRGGLNIERVHVARALGDFHEAYDLFRKLGDTGSQTKALLSIAYLYLQAKDYNAVLKYTQQAQQASDGDANILLSIYNNRALALNELGRFAAAEAQVLRALRVARTMHSAMLEAQVLRNLARTRLLAGKVAEAERTIEEAHLVSSIMGSAESRAADALAAKIAFRQRRMGEAERLITRSFAGIDLGTTQLSSREAHETAYRIYAARGEEGRALAHLAAQKRLDDEATKLATTTSTALMGARFDFANQELKIANLQRDEARRNVESQRTIFLGGAGAVTLIILLLLAGLFTIRRSRDQVRAVAADLRISNGALGKALAAKTEFLATTSHEIRTPLNGILGMTQVILADRDVEPTLRDRIKIVHAAGTTMRVLVDDILDIAKMETGNLTIEEAPFDPRATLADAARLWEEQARARGIGFRVDLDGCPTTMLGDAARVRQVAFNLLSNALKFTREGSVLLRVAQVDPTIEIAVIDTGIGIPADKLEEIFESFRQADAGTTREFGGTGLGLSICRNLAEAMGGRIEVTSVVGGGSTFTVSLPFRTPMPAAAAATVPRTSALLVIDRNPIARAMLRTLFAPRVEVAFAGSADEAAGWLADHDAIAVLADAATLPADADVVSAVVGRRVLLCADDADARARARHGWQVIARPIAGAHLVELVLAPTVVSSSDTLAMQAA